MTAPTTTNGNGKNGMATMGLTGWIRRLSELSIVAVFVAVVLFLVREQNTAAREDRAALREAIAAVLREAVKGQREDIRKLAAAVEKLAEKMAEKQGKGRD